ncbi:MAG: radical SAM protein [Candidatus Edwardsbacteria bacterium]|jgi:radical SAM protein with 4Fe4S-binding SPASM domain|nr:radical SAM protein [Candidatus Edwardsbacteria bacterium]
MKARRAPRLRQLDVELTERCNNDCVHCCINLPAGDGRARRRELTAAQLDRVFAQAAQLGCLTVRLTGGEPLLREDFKEIYLAARRRGLTVRLSTNGCLLTPALAELLAAVPPLEPVELTAYGRDRGSYERVTRVPGSFARFRAGLDLLAGHRVPFRLKGVLFRGTARARRGFEAWAAKLSGARPELTLLLDLRHRRDSTARDRAIAMRRLTPRQVARTTCADPLFREQMKLFPARYMGPQGDRLFTCSAGTSVCLDAYGRLQPCLLLRDPRLSYDLVRGSLRRALSDFFPRVLAVRAENPDYLRRCARCRLKGFCRQCPARAFIEHGALDRPVDHLCRVARAQAQLLGWPLRGIPPITVDRRAS